MALDWFDDDDTSLYAMGTLYNYTITPHSLRGWTVEQTSLTITNETILLKRTWAKDTASAIKQVEGWENGYEQHLAADHMRNGLSGVAARNRRNLRKGP